MFIRLLWRIDLRPARGYYISYEACEETLFCRPRLTNAHEVLELVSFLVLIIEHEIVLLDIGSHNNVY